MFGNNEPLEHASRNAENAFLGVELNVLCPEALECNVEVIYQIMAFLVLTTISST
jgi:hypothetical protein